MALKIYSLPSRVFNRLRRDCRLLRRRVFKAIWGLPPFDLAHCLDERGPIENVIFDSICLPPYAEPWRRESWRHDDFSPLMEIVRFLQPRLVLELGTGHGNTVANICQQCQEATVFTVNALAEQQTGRAVTYRLNKEEIGRVYREHGFAERVVQIYANTLHLELSPDLKGQSVDLCIIDACHDVDYVINDFFKVQPFVRAGGVVLLHDTHESMLGHLEGSYQACMVLRRMGHDICHIPDTWWGIWINGPRIERRRWLAASSCWVGFSEGHLLDIVRAIGLI